MINFNDSAFDGLRRVSEIYSNIEHFTIANGAYEAINRIAEQQLEIQKAAAPIMSMALGNFASSISNSLSQFDYTSAIRSASAALQSVDIGLMQQYTRIYEELATVKPLLSAFGEFQKSIAFLSNFTCEVNLSEIENIFRRYEEVFRDIDDSDSLVKDDNTVIHNGVEYKNEALVKEFNDEIQELKQNPASIKDKIENVKQKFWLLILLLTIFNGIPQLFQSVEFYKEACRPLIESVLDMQNFQYVIKERAYMRKEASSKSDVLVEITYAEQVEIIEEIPYWYKVRYWQEEEYIGWISKISIGTEDDIDDR